MNNKMMMLGFWTMSIVFACQGAEKQVHEPLAQLRNAINASSASTYSKELQREALKKMVEDKLRYMDRKDSTKARKALQTLQHRINQDQHPKSGKILFN